MTHDFLLSDTAIETGSSVESDTDRMESMRVLLADLRASIETQRHLINVSRTLLERS